MSFKWSENEFAYLNDDNQTLASIGFKMINDNKTYVVERTWVDEKARGQGLAKKITVEFLHYVRKEQKFDSVAQLSEQMHRDAEFGMQYVKDLIS